MRRRPTGAAPVAASSSASGKLFGKLDAIAVRVEDIEQPDLAVQLEHGADFDPLAAEAIGLGLDVLDVDRRDTGLFLRFALRDRDLHLAAHEPRPAALLVQVGLHEAKLAGVEGSAGVEVTHVVPDLDRVHSIRPGSSRKALTVLRKSAAVAPSSER